jgi:hypothetical protein
MARFGATAHALRGPFRRLMQKLVAVGRRPVIDKASRLPGREARLLARANRHRDTELERLVGVGRKERPATVVGAYNARTGKVAVGTSSKARQECAEAAAVRKLGSIPADVRFTIAKRANGSGPPFKVVPVCAPYCEPAYGRAAFPDAATQFQSDVTGKGAR